MPTSPLFPVTLALYAASCALYLAQVATAVVATAGAEAPSLPGVRLARAARWLLGLAFLSHAVDIGFLCVRGLHPLVNAREALSFIGWLTVGAYLAATLRQKLPLAGALIVPVTLVLDVAARVAPGAHTPADHAMTMLMMMHIGLAGAGIALFAVAAGDAAVYLYAEGQLKGRRPPGPGLPPLETLDRLNRRCIQLGFPLFTVAMVMGAILLSRLPPTATGMSRLLQPQYALSAVAWGLYAGLLLLRLLVGWRGRRAALVTLGGFAASVGVLVVYFVRDVIGWGA